MTLTRRDILLGFAASGVLVACGSSGEPSSSSTTSADATGEDRRILVLGEEYLLADMLALGIRPVASTATASDQGFVGLDEFDTDGIDALPATEPNLERLAGYRPDVVVTIPFVVEEVGRERLVPGAELVVIDATDDRDQLLQIADAFDRRPKAEELLAQLDKELADSREKLNGEGRGVSVATVYPGPSVAAWVDGPTAIPATLIELGFTLSPGSEDGIGDENGRAFLSDEQVGLLDAEMLITLQSSIIEGEAAAVTALEQDSLWQTLPAVQAGRIVEIDRLGYPGIAGRTRLLPDLVGALS